MKKALALILTVLMLGSMFPASIAAQAENVTKKGFYLANWDRKVANDEYQYDYVYGMPYTWINSANFDNNTESINIGVYFDSYSTSDLKAAAAGLKEEFDKFPAGARYINLAAMGTVFKDCVKDAIDMEDGVRLVADWVDRFMAEYKAIGGKLGLPTTFDMERPTNLMYILPIVSLALPSIANLMKWLRRYMIDQMNSDYVKFARSGGLSESEIFRKHILKNAIIPVVHGIPGSVLGALTGAIITERVYMVPGIGNVLTEAINKYDNGVIVGVALFYALLSVTSFILGDVLMSVMDPRISFTSKAR